MVAYSGKDLARGFRTVRENTIKVVEEIPEGQLDFASAPGTRTFRQLITHIIQGDGFAGVHRERRTSFDGLNFGQIMAEWHADEQRMRTKAELLDLLKTRGEATAAWMDTLDDAFLAERFNQPPNVTPTTKSRLEMLMGLKEHEMHHRAQLMLMLRLIGQVPPLTRARQERAAASASQSRS